MSNDKLVSMENELIYEFVSYEDTILFLNRHLLNKKVDTILSYFITNIHRRLDNLEGISNIMEDNNEV